MLRTVHLACGADCRFAQVRSDDADADWVRCRHPTGPGVSHPGHDCRWFTPRSDNDILEIDREPLRSD